MPDLVGPQMQLLELDEGGGLVLPAHKVKQYLDHAATAADARAKLTELSQGGAKRWRASSQPLGGSAKKPRVEEASAREPAPAFTFGEVLPSKEDLVGGTGHRIDTFTKDGKVRAFVTEAGKDMGWWCQATM